MSKLSSIPKLNYNLIKKNNRYDPKISVKKIGDPRSLNSINCSNKPIYLVQ